MLREDEAWRDDLRAAVLREMAATEETHAGEAHMLGAAAECAPARAALADQARVLARALCARPDAHAEDILAETLRKLAAASDGPGAPDAARWAASLDAQLPPAWRAGMRALSAQLEPPSRGARPASAFVSAAQLAGKPAVGTGSASPANNSGSRRPKSDQTQAQGEEDPRLANIEPKLLEHIRSEIIARVDAVEWDMIAGLEHAKRTIMEMVIWPMQRPDIFTGLRGPPKGLLLFGPPGTGKTMIGKCIASQAAATFFAISASSLTSKWVGEGEKLVRALFAVARVHQPSVVFIDEIDSLLTQRSDSEFEASRRIKTEFLVQFDGAATSSSDRILIVGATNRPHELDEAARRRLVKRLYVPLPDASARAAILRRLLGTQGHTLSDADVDRVVQLTDGYSGADMDSLCREAALGPIRELGPGAAIMSLAASQVRPISASDVLAALRQVRASVSQKDLEGYRLWNEQYGSLSM